MVLTQQDIAKAAGVSQRTVAQVVGSVSNRRVRVSAATRERILKVAGELGYRPQRQAQLLRGVKSGLIGMVRPVSLHQGGVETAYHISLAVHQAGYGLVTHELLWGGLKHFEDTINLLLDAKVEGILLDIGGRQGVHPDFNLSGISVPMVSLGGEIPGYPSVAPDFKQGNKDLVKHLIALGYRRLAHEVALRPTAQAAGNEASLADPTRLRLEGFREACAEAGLGRDDTRIIWQATREGFFDAFEPGRECAKAFLKRDGAEFDVLLCQNDFHATGAQKFFLENGIDIPATLAMTGFDNTALARQLPVPLTSVELPTAEVANIAVDILMRLISGEESREAMAKTILRPCELVIRDSCGAPGKFCTNFPEQNNTTTNNHPRT